MFPTFQRIVLLHLGGSDIRTTAEHPFYVPGKGWIAAADLRPGDTLLTPDGQTLIFGSVADDNPGESSVSAIPSPSTAPRLILGFAAGTPVRTASGSKPIEQLHPGDLIQTQPDDCEGDHAGEDARWWEWN